ncbi:MAG: hypothetical protein AB1646_22135 [Thermodesulfobacteriota bacterium]
MESSKADDKEQVEKYKQLYSMAEAAFRDEENRYSRIQDQAFKYDPIILFLLGVAGFLAKWIRDELRTATDCWGCGAMTSLVLAFGCLIVAAFVLLVSRLYGKTKSFRPDQRDVEFFDAYDLTTLYRAYARRFHDETRTNAKITDKKARRVVWAHALICLSSGLLIITGLIWILR